MNYNTSRPPLVFREYGRNIQKLINHIAQIEDRKERTKKAKALVEALAQMDSEHTDNDEFRHKLWDHVFIMSDGELDVDAPYSKPEKGATTITKPKKRLSYPKEDITYHHYGKNVELFLQKIDELDSKEEKEALVNLLSKYMKMAYKKWSSDNVSDDIILSDLQRLAGDKIDIDDNKRIRSSKKRKKRKKRKKKRSRRKS